MRLFADAEQRLLEAHTEEDIAGALLRIESLNEGMSRQFRMAQLLKAQRDAERCLDQADEKEEHPAYFICEWVARSVGCTGKELMNAAATNFRGNPDLVDRLHQRDEAGDAARVFEMLETNEYLAKHQELAKRLGHKSFSSGQTEGREAQEKPAAAHSGGKLRQNRQRATSEEANSTAIDLAKHDRNFPSLGCRAMATQISRKLGKTCSESLVRKTEYWTKLMDVMGRSRTRGERRPKVVLDGQRELRDLVAEQQEDYEPSPTSDEDVSVRTIKRV